MPVKDIFWIPPKYILKGDVLLYAIFHESFEKYENEADLVQFEHDLIKELNKLLSKGEEVHRGVYFFPDFPNEEKTMQYTTKEFWYSILFPYLKERYIKAYVLDPYFDKHKEAEELIRKMFFVKEKKTIPEFELDVLEHDSLFELENSLLKIFGLPRKKQFVEPIHLFRRKSKPNELIDTLRAKAYIFLTSVPKSESELIEDYIEFKISYGELVTETSFKDHPYIEYILSQVLLLYPETKDNVISEAKYLSSHPDLLEGIISGYESYSTYEERMKNLDEVIKYAELDYLDRFMKE